MKQKFVGLLVVLLVVLMLVGSLQAGSDAYSLKPGQSAEVVCDQSAPATLTVLKSGVTVIGVRIECAPLK